MNDLLKELQYCFVTGFYSGLLPKAPGTFASFLGILLSLFILLHFNFSFYLGITFFLWLYGLKAIKSYEIENKIHDDPKTAIDEIIGIFFTVIFAFPLINLNNKWILGEQLLGLFLLFRFFDITKPGYIGTIDKEVHGELGTVLDDIMAGFYSAIIFALIKYFIFS